MSLSLFENYKNDYLTNLKKLVSFKTFLSNSDEYPNSEQLKAIKFLVELGNKEGFKTFYDEKGYYGYIEYGEGEKIIGILTHIDVVSPGDLTKWNSDPFDMQIKDDLLVGRGVVDDKGPLMLIFYLLKMFKDENTKFSKRIRLIFGSDEEILWRGINKYVEKEEKIEMGFTPDSSFPVTYAEKGLLQWKLEEDFKDKSFKIFGGESVNAVPNSATYEGSKTKEIANKLEEMNFEYSITGNKIVVSGKSAHAMEPEKGINAIQRLLMAVNEIEDSKIVKFIANELNLEVNGVTLFGKEIKDEETGTITLNIGKLELNDGKLVAVFDNRIPVLATNKDEIEKILKEKAKKYDLEYIYFDFLKPIYAEKNSFLIRTLMESYERITKSNEKPFVSGGATYARSMDNVFAFGPFKSNEENTEHQENERVNIKVFEDAFEIYKDVIINLTK